MSEGFVLDADAFICLHSLSVPELISTRNCPGLYLTEYVARHELSTLSSHVTALESSGRIRVFPVASRDAHYKRFKQGRKNKGEAEIVAWLLGHARTERPRFISNDRGAHDLAAAERVPSGDLLDFILALVAHETLTLEEAEDKLAPWSDRGQQRCRPSDFTSFQVSVSRRQNR